MASTLALSKDNDSIIFTIRPVGAAPSSAHPRRGYASSGVTENPAGPGVDDFVPAATGRGGLRSRS
ncbi:hypothetical protein, partial [Kitasatospora sp. NPDC093558]|uniref:hypothetical protein n=1 Tax=Kitasatospora sp. NPDC093558 TaxID=3155201 RepID=UPI00342A9093